MNKKKCSIGNEMKVLYREDGEYCILIFSSI